MFIPLDYTSICFWKTVSEKCFIKKLYWTGVIWSLLTKSTGWGYPIRWPGSSKEWQRCLLCFPLPCGLNWLQRPQLLFNLSKYDSWHSNPPPNKRQKENKFGGPKWILERKGTLLKINWRWGLHSMGGGLWKVLTCFSLLRFSRYQMLKDFPSLCSILACLVCGGW